MNKITKVFNHLVTGKDNTTHDIARWSWMVSAIIIIIGALWNSYESNLFGLRDFAQAIGIIAGAHGAAIFAKQNTEPREDTSQEVPDNNK
jgi:hypothetical protein